MINILVVVFYTLVAAFASIFLAYIISEVTLAFVAIHHYIESRKHNKGNE